MAIYNSKPENKDKQQAAKFLDAFNSRGARLLEEEAQGNLHILVGDPSILFYLHPMRGRIPTPTGFDHSMEESESIVNTSNDNVLESGSMLATILSLPSLFTGLGDDVASTKISKNPEYTYLDQV